MPRVDFRSFGKKLSKQDKNPFPIGTRVYVGHQGKGKTLSMVDYAYRLAAVYPEMVLYTNVIIKKPIGIKVFAISTPEGLKKALEHQNGEKGVLVLLDEAHLFWSKKDGIPLEVIGAISQQRKDRRRIVFTTQVWYSMDIDLRRQVKEVVVCRQFPFWQKLQWNTVFDGETVKQTVDNDITMDRIFTEFFKHNDEYHTRYDTHQKITKNSDHNPMRYGATVKLHKKAIPKM